MKMYKVDELTERQIEQIKNHLAGAGLTVDVTGFADDHGRAGDALVLVKSSSGILSQHTVSDDGGKLSIHCYP